MNLPWSPAQLTHSRRSGAPCLPTATRRRRCDGSCASRTTGRYAGQAGGLTRAVRGGYGRRDSPQPRSRESQWPRAVSARHGLFLASWWSPCSPDARIPTPPTSVTESGATLNGRVHPRSMRTTWWFEYGTTATYGSKTAPEVIDSGDSEQPVSKRVSGLSPARVYHYRLCDLGEDGHGNCGLDRSFTTAPARLAPGFTESVPIGGLTQPTAVRFAPDGRVFVAEKSGLIKVFDALDDTLADRLRRPARRDSTTSGTAGCSAWRSTRSSRPSRSSTSRTATTRQSAGRRRSGANLATRRTRAPPRPDRSATDAWLSGRISRLTADEDRVVGPEQVLVEDFCQQFPIHSMGSLAFGPDGSLYAAAGDAAHPNNVDYGEYGSPLNPCGDPPGEPGDALGPPTAEGGALRAQDLRTGGDPAGLAGSLIRIDPDAGEGVAGQPRRRKRRPQRQEDRRLRAA